MNNKGIVLLQETGAMPRKLPLQLLERITDNFSNEREIGRGANGIVYKGTLDKEEIAVKKLYNHPGLHDDQFNECINLMRVRHPNIVRLIGYCYETEKKLTEYNGKLVFADVEDRALCLEYMEGGSLERHISEVPCQLDWCTCYGIIKGISEGLRYLHMGFRNPIFHLDLKPANILLDRDNIPKIGDFGLSRVGSTQTHVTQKPMGTFGYMPPEYIDKQQITSKFDVFSSGVIILQIMAGRTGSSQRTDMPSGEFIKIVHEHWKKRMHMTMWTDASREVKTCIEIALRCVENDRAKRPTIAEIVDKLNKIDTSKSSCTCEVIHVGSEQNSDERCTSSVIQIQLSTLDEGLYMPPDGHKSLVEGKHFVSCSALQEHHKFFEVPINNVGEVHSQSFEPSTSKASCSLGRMPDDAFSARTRSLSPEPRGHAFSVSDASQRDFGFSPRSPLKRMDDLRISPQPLPLPPVPVSSLPIPLSSIASTQSQSQWKKGKLLGSGSFGQVYLGFNSESGQFCAIKEVQVISDDSNSKERLRQLNQEVDLLSQLSHQNIVQYYGSELTDEALSIYLEYVSGGSIHKLLREYGPFREPTIRNYTRQILSGLAYLHGRNTVHRDIKGANILVGPTGNVKLADFGVAKHITSFAEIRSFRGSPYWMAPEVIMNNKGYSLAVDIWSLGCTIIEMATARHPWHPYEDVPALFKIANSKDTPEIPESISKEGKDFLSLCLKRDPAQRPSATQLLGHPFVHDYQAIRAVKCRATPLSNGLSSPVEARHKKSNREYSTKRGITPLRDIGELRARDFTGFATACPSPLNTSSPIAARTNISLPVSPCSSPLGQFKQSNWSCLPSPPHPVDYTQNQMRLSTSVPDPWLGIGQWRPPSPYGSPRRL